VLTYSKEDYGRIAKAIDKSPAEVAPYENEVEAAATWYRLNIPPAERKGPSTSGQRRRPTTKPKTLSERRKERFKKPKTLKRTNPVKRRSASAAALADARYRKRVSKSARLYSRKDKPSLRDEDRE
jgi:hypothetical protein